jgi:hypothetical protein
VSAKKREAEALQRGLVIGIGFGLGVSAGLAGECQELTTYQLGTMLDELSINDAVAEAIAREVWEQTRRGDQPTPAGLRDIIAKLLATHAKSRGGDG